MMSDDDKWSTFQNIDAQCWTQIAPPNQGFAVWQLRDDWLGVLFNGAYRTLRVNADVSLSTFRAIAFVTPDDVYEARIFSQQRGGEFYDFKWTFSPTPGAGNQLASAPETSSTGTLNRRVVQISLSNGTTAAASANVIWLIHPAQITPPIPSAAKNFRIFCASVDETIDFNLDALELHRQETAQEANMRLEPWQRLLMWMARLETIDHAAFSKLPPALRRWLNSAGIKMQPGAVTERDISTLQQEGTLPQQLALLKPEDITTLRESIKLQQSIDQRPDVLIRYNQISPIPKLLMHVDVFTLDPIDLQVFMTIGALREVHGFLEVEMERLLQRRPDLQALSQSPQGARQMDADAEVLTLKSHPKAASEQQDEQDVMLRRAGNYGPTMREVFEVEKQRLETMQAQTMNMLGPMIGMAAGLQANNPPAEANPGPPWKIYKPYLC